MTRAIMTPSVTSAKAAVCPASLVRGMVRGTGRVVLGEGEVVGVVVGGGAAPLARASTPSAATAPGHPGVGVTGVGWGTWGAWGIPNIGVGMASAITVCPAVLGWR